MRGADHQQSGMFSYISPEKRVPKDHPLRTIRAMIDAAASTFPARYAVQEQPPGQQLSISGKKPLANFAGLPVDASARVTDGLSTGTVPLGWWGSA